MNEPSDTNEPIGVDRFPFPGADHWDRAGEMLADPLCRCFSIQTEKGCFLGGADLFDPLIDTLAEVTPAYHEAAADIRAYDEEHRGPDGLTESPLWTPKAVEERFEREDKKYWAAQGNLARAIEQAACATVLEALTLAGVTEKEKCAEIVRRVFKGA